MRRHRVYGVAVALVVAGCTGVKQPAAPPRTDTTSLEAQDPTLAGALAEARLKPTGDAHRRVGLEFLRLHVLDQAFEHLSDAIKQDPRDAAAYEARARIWREWNVPGRAHADAVRALQLAPRSASAHNTLGTVLYALGRVSDAEQEFSAAFGLDATAGYAANNLCFIAIAAGDTDTALGRCRQALEVTPGLAAAHENLALIFAATDIARAERELGATGDPARSRYNLGILHLARGEYDAAAAAFTLACSERPPVRDACQRAEHAWALSKRQ